MTNLTLIKLPLLLLFCLQSFAQSASENDGYEIVRQDEKITMYERWTPYPGTTTNARQIKCVILMNTELNKAYANIYEDGKIQTWQKNILEYKITPRNDTSWIAYSYYRIPWPLSNQDYLLKYSLLEKNERRIVLAFTHLQDEKIVPIRDGVDRRPTIGKWELEKVANGKTKITYTITSMPLNTPRFITDRIVHNNLMSTINELITVAEK